MWLPRFVCPECQTQVQEAGIERFACADCGSVFDRQGDVWRFLTEARRAQLDPFIRQYRLVRQREGRRLSTPDYYRRLPSVAQGDPHSQEWEIRHQTYDHLLRHVLAARRAPIQVLDVGAGSGWLSHRLAALGHRAVAVDAIADDVDGLGATRHYAVDLTVVQADFDALPFASCQFDLVVFNGSLHYAADPAATLERTQGLLAPGGALVVMDSPMFRADADGVRDGGRQDPAFRVRVWLHRCGAARRRLSHICPARPCRGEVGASGSVRPVARPARLAPASKRLARALASRAGCVRPVGGAMIDLRQSMGGSKHRVLDAPDG